MERKINQDTSLYISFGCACADLLIHCIDKIEPSPIFTQVTKNKAKNFRAELIKITNLLYGGSKHLGTYEVKKGKEVGALPEDAQMENFNTQNFIETIFRQMFALDTETREQILDIIENANKEKVIKDLI